MKPHCLINASSRFHTNFSFPLMVSLRPRVLKTAFRADLESLQDPSGLGGYAPGKVLVIDDIEYMVGGLAFFNPPSKHNQARHVLGPDAREESLRWFSRCVQPRCGWVYGNLHEPFTGEICPVCGENEFLVSRWFRPDGFAPIIIHIIHTTNRSRRNEEDGPEMRQAPPQDSTTKHPPLAQSFPRLHPEDEHSACTPSHSILNTSERFSPNNALTSMALR